MKLSKGKSILGGIVLFVWALSGIYIVDDSEDAVVKTFGSHTATVTNSGMKYHLPYPFQTVQTENVAEPKQDDFGFTTLKQGDTKENSQYQTMPHEALMITGDENLVEMQVSAQWQIMSISDYLFNVDDQRRTLRMAGEAAIREVVKRYTFDDAITDNRMTIQQDIRDILQEKLNEYEMGVQVLNITIQDANPPAEVNDAFLAVQDAKEQKDSLQNEAKKIANKKIPEARAKANEMINEAEAEKASRIAMAKGDVEWFIQLHGKYLQGKEVTKTRLYLETMSEILPGVDKVIVSDENGDTVKFLPLGKNAGINQ